MATTQAEVDALVVEVLDLKNTFIEQSNKILEEITKPKDEINIDALREVVGDLRATAEGSLKQLDDVNPDAVVEPPAEPSENENTDGDLVS